MLANLFKLFVWIIIGLVVYVGQAIWNGGDLSIGNGKPTSAQNEVNTQGGLIVPVDPRFN